MIKTLNLQIEKYQQSPDGKKKNKAFVSENKSKKELEIETEPMCQYIKEKFLINNNKHKSLM